MCSNAIGGSWDVFPVAELERSHVPTARNSRSVVTPLMKAFMLTKLIFQPSLMLTLQIESGTVK